jgi:predicted RNA-binding protein with PUA-like domain
MAKKRTPNTWLMKSEPDVFSIDDLKAQKTSPWDGVRNYQARNNMREMKVGDLVLFYHSNAKPPGVVGIARVCAEAYPDHTAWDPASKYFDPKSTPDAPRWEMVDVEYVETFPRMIPLEELKADPDLEGMVVTRRSRLSVTPVDHAHFRHIVRLGGAKTKL